MTLRNEDELDQTRPIQTGWIAIVTLQQKIVFDTSV